MNDIFLWNIPLTAHVADVILDSDVKLIADNVLHGFDETAKTADLEVSVYAEREISRDTTGKDDAGKLVESL